MKTAHQPNTGGHVTWQGDDCFTHMLVVGPTRTGKSASLLKPLIYQLLLQKKRGKKLGLTVIEPKGDVAQLCHDVAIEMAMSDVHIDPLKEDSQRFNAMEGEINSVIEATVIVLQSLFGQQEEFFTNVQELATRYITKLLKMLYGDQIDIMDVLMTLRNEKRLASELEQLKEQDPNSDVVEFFEQELLGSLAEHYRKIVVGLRAQLENITSNELLQKVMTGQSDIDLDDHLAHGGILSVNTAMGEMGKSGDTFGQFLMMHLQNATMRRPGTEKTRTPHYLIIDEFSLYVNPEVKRFLAVAAGYRVASIVATQSLGDLEVESGEISAEAMKQAVMTNCRNKITFGGLGAEDAKEFQEEFGVERVTAHQGTYANKIFSLKLRPDSYREVETVEYRFPYDYLMYGMERFHFVHKMVDEGVQQQPGEAVGRFIPHDWCQRQEWEKNSSSIKQKVKHLSRQRNRKEMAEAAEEGEASSNEETDELVEDISDSVDAENQNEFW